MLRIAVCDDNKNAAKTLEEILLQENEQNQISLFYDGQELINCGCTFDLLFLDIDMPGMDGIDVARKIRRHNKSIPIVYVTSYEEYTHLAFSVHAFGYIVKPAREEIVQNLLQDVREYVKTQEKSEDLHFETMAGAVVVNTKDIYYFEYENRKTTMVAETGRKILRNGITQTAERMQTFGFAMPHKSFCVNLYYIKTIKGYDIYMMNGDIIPLSQKKSPEFRRQLLQYQTDCLMERRR